MQSRKRLMRAWLIHTFVLIVACLAAGIMANAQITRDVGQIAVIEGDDRIIKPPKSDDNPCGKVTVKIEEVAKKFYLTHPNDEFQFLIMFTNFNYLLDPDENCEEQAFAFNQSVSNSTRGIGAWVGNNSAAFGSSGRLESFLNMNNLAEYPADPSRRFLRNNSTLSLLGQEGGHRWGAYVRFDSDPDPSVKKKSDLLLGRDRQHWSFLFHTGSATSSASNPEASSLEGNYWNVIEPGKFRSATITDGFSPLDLYLMGLLPADQVGALWYIADPDYPDLEAIRSHWPVDGSEIKGTQRFVTIQDIIEAEGPRVPSFAASPKKFRQAFILLTKPGEDVTQSQLDKIERFRAAWENYFAEKTSYCGRVSASLDGVIYVDRANTGAEDGSRANPYNTVAEGIEHSAPRGTLVIKAGNYAEGNLTFTRFNVPLTIRAEGGPVTIGR